MTDRYQGDPKVTIGPNGANLTFKGGQPVMDQGLENAAFISLHTRPGWWGNVLARTDSEKIGSIYEKVSQSVVTLNTLEDRRSAALGALNWMLKDNIASDIKVAVSNPESNRIETIIAILPPGRDLEILLATKHGENWVSQKINPAYKQV